MLKVLRDLGKPPRVALPSDDLLQDRNRRDTLLPQVNIPSSLSLYELKALRDVTKGLYVYLNFNLNVKYEMFTLNKSLNIFSARNKVLIATRNSLNCIYKPKYSSLAPLWQS